MNTPQDILCFSSIDWDFIWQGHQEVMVRFARAGHRVLFIENTGARMPRLRDLSRVRQRWRNWWHGVQGIRKVEEGLYVYAPLVLPFPYARAARWLNRWFMSLTLRSWMRAVGFKQPLAWVFLPTPLTLELLRDLDPILTVYYCIDSFATSSPAAKKMAWAEAQLIRRADVVFVTSKALRVHCERWNSRVHEFPFGVNLQLFDEIASSCSPLPADLEALPRPRVGYVGGIHQWVDQDLLRLLAQRHRDCSFVLIGPVQTDVSNLRGLPNLHLLGAKPHQELPRYIQGFDVCLIPYQLTEYTRHVYPTKLNEYFALGRPVVSTALPEVIIVAQQAQESVLIGREPEEFSRHLSRLLADGDHQGAEQRRSIAEENSWARKVERMTQLIEERMAQRWLEQDSRWAERLLAPQRVVLRRLGQAAVTFGLLYGMLFHTPFLWWAASPLRVDQPPVASDAIVVFAAGMGESGRAGQGYQERIQHAVQLYRAGYAPRLILVSGYRYVIKEADVMRALAMTMGVPPEAIELETRPVNTYEGIILTGRRLQQRRAGRILFVSSPYHMRRALLVWRHQAPWLDIRCSPIPISSFYGSQRRVLPKHIRAIVHEYMSLAYYWWQGYWR